MPKRRGHNEGSIYQRPSGRWRVLVTLPSGDRTGENFRTRREAQDWLTRTLGAMQAGLDVSPQRITVAGLLERWMSDVAAHTLRPKTLESYESLIRLHILPELGALKVTALQPAHLQRLYSTKLDSLSPRSVRYLHAVIHRALAQAVRWGIVPRNVADAVDPPKPQRPAMHVLSPEQARQFLAAVREDRLYALYLLAILTGMREGELLGLHWSAVDLERGTIQVTATIQRLWHVGLVEGEPKTASGRRQIAVPAPVIAALRAHRRRQLEERLFVGGQWQDNDLVFTTAKGKPIDPRSLLRQFHADLERAGLAPMRFHELRHTAASLALAEGAHPKIVQELLGHSQIGVTLDTYSHTMPSMQLEALDRVGRLLDVENG